MFILHSVPAAVLLILSICSSLLCRAGKAPLLTGLLVVVFETVLTCLILMSGGSMHEALACLLFPLFVMLP